MEYSVLDPEMVSKAARALARNANPRFGLASELRALMRTPRLRGLGEASHVPVYAVDAGLFRRRSDDGLLVIPETFYTSTRGRLSGVVGPAYRVLFDDAGARVSAYWDFKEVSLGGKHVWAASGEKARILEGLVLSLAPKSL